MSVTIRVVDKETRVENPLTQKCVTLFYDEEDRTPNSFPLLPYKENLDTSCFRVTFFFYSLEDVFLGTSIISSILLFSFEKYPIFMEVYMKFGE